MYGRLLHPTKITDLKSGDRIGEMTPFWRLTPPVPQQLGFSG